MSVRELIEQLTALNCPGAEVLAEPSNSDTLCIHFVSGGLAGGVRLECEGIDYDDPPTEIKERIEELEEEVEEHRECSQWAVKVHGLLEEHKPEWATEELMEEFPE